MLMLFWLFWRFGGRGAVGGDSAFPCSRFLFVAAHPRKIVMVIVFRTENRVLETCIRGCPPLQVSFWV